MCDEELPPPIVIHCGSSMSRAGFAVEDQPRSVFPSLVGRPLPDPAAVGSSRKDTHVGDEAKTERRGVFDTWSPCPLEGGVVMDWDGMEKIWQHIFYNELRVNPENQPVLISEPPLNPRPKRERTAEVVFEEESSFFRSSHPFACNIHMVSSGHTISHSVPLYEGYPLNHGIKTVNVGGRDVTDHLVKLLAEKGHHLGSTKDRETVRNFKEKHCFVSNNYQVFPPEYGTSISLENERTLGPEVLFKPELLGRDGPSEPSSMRMEGEVGLGEAAHNSSRLARGVPLTGFPWLHPWDMLRNVVLAGGNSLFPGLPERIASEMGSHESDPNNWTVKVIATPERKEAVWIGGSVLASISTFKDLSISKEEYLERGSQLVNVKEEEKEAAWKAAIIDREEKIQKGQRYFPIEHCW